MYKHTFYYFLGNKKYPEIYILLLEMSEPDFHFTFHFLNFQYPLLQGTGPPPPQTQKRAESTNQAD